jgi:hypothetical protein
MAGVVIDAYGERRTNRIMRDTWGHMDANPGTRYKGHIIFAEGVFGGDRIILESEFGNAGYGPWFYDGIMDWLFDQNIEAGKIYRFDGFYRLAPGGAHDFVGDISSTDI